MRVQLPRPHVEDTLVGSQGGALGWAIDRATRDDRRFVVVVTPDEPSARHLQNMLATLRPEGISSTAIMRLLDYQPYGGMSPSRALIMDRATTLFRLLHDPKLRTLIVPARSMLDKYPPSHAIKKHCMELEVGQEVAIRDLTEFLVEGGYNASSVVSDPGCFAQRGGLLDVFFPLYPHPVRIDFWGDQIDSMRFFDATTQRTKHTTKRILLGPVTTFLAKQSVFLNHRQRYSRKSAGIPDSAASS